MLWAPALPLLSLQTFMRVASHQLKCVEGTQGRESPTLKSQDLKASPDW